MHTVNRVCRRRSPFIAVAPRTLSCWLRPHFRPPFALSSLGPFLRPTSPLSLLVLATFPAFSRRLGLLLLPSLSLATLGLLLLPANPLSPFSTLALGLFPRSLLPLPTLALISLRLLLLPASPFSPFSTLPLAATALFLFSLLPARLLSPFLTLPFGLISRSTFLSVALVVAVTVAERLVRLLNRLEDPLGSLVSGVLVGMVLQRQAAVRRPDLSVRRSRLEAEDFVRIDVRPFHSVLLQLQQWVVREPRGERAVRAVGDQIEGFEHDLADQRFAQGGPTTQSVLMDRLPI